jgi:O-antigen ligase
MAITNITKGISVDKLALSVFLACLFIVKVPPFYIISTSSQIFASHTLAKGTLGIIFVTLALINFNKYLSVIKKNGLLFSLILLFFAGQSLSVLATQDIILFWKGYQNVIAGILIFLLAFLFAQDLKSYKKIISFTLVAGFSLITLEVIYFIFVQDLMNLFQNFFQKEVYYSYLSNIQRGRYSLDMNTELFAPFFIVAIFLLKKTSKKIWLTSWLFTAFLIFISFVSNFRTRVFNLLFSVTAILPIAISKIRKRLTGKYALKGILVVTVLLLPAILSISISNKLFSFNILERFALADQREDVSSLSFRIESAQKSLAIYRSSPLFGVGLGNYLSFSTDSLSKFSFYLLQEENRLEYEQLSQADPHNVIFRLLAETGFIGTSTYLLLLSYFFIKDLEYIKRTKTISFTHAYIVSFWTIFAFILLNPSYSIFVIGWFWFLRGVAEARKVKDYEIIN